MIKFFLKGWRLQVCVCVTLPFKTSFAPLFYPFAPEQTNGLLLRAPSAHLSRLRKMPLWYKEKGQTWLIYVIRSNDLKAVLSEKITRKEMDFFRNVLVLLLLIPNPPRVDARGKLKGWRAVSLRMWLLRSGWGNNDVVTFQSSLTMQMSLPLSPVGREK